LYLAQSYHLCLLSDALDTHDLWDEENRGKRDFFITEMEQLKVLCAKGELPVTAIAVGPAILALMAPTFPGKLALKQMVETVRGRLTDELSTKLFFQLPHSRKEFFEEPRKRWGEVTGRFPNAIRDIDEASKCFALSRYAACVFHCVQIIEHGLLPLGAFLSINDPLSAWTAVAKELKKIIDKKHDQRSDFEKKHFPFIEQMQDTVEALKNAWRNKISHAHGQRLVLVDSEFTPDTAEEIMTATRSFMRRLAESLPQ
jgi:HEPN domain-containing protein